MDVLKFLQNGNIKPNPEYNPKTKKGKFQSPTLVDYNPGTSASDTARSDIARLAAPNLYSFNTDDVNKYAEYNTYLNPYDTQEELDKERADNQSWIEQTGYAIGQGVVNEVVLGTFLGLSNIVDFAINGVKAAAGQGWDSDYSNPVSKYLEDLQEDVRKSWEIYQTNPGEAWSLGDFGWWANNMVSVLSTASMLVPTYGITRGLSALGRGIRAASAAGKGGKIIKGLDFLGNKASAENIAMKLAKNFGDKYDVFKDVGKLSDQLKLGREITQNAVLSRTMENYLEARETHKIVEESAYARLQGMSKEDKDEFFKNNPTLVGKSDEEIAKYIAGEAADTTFVNDYAMLLMDIVQFKGLSDIYKGGHKASNASLALATKKEKDKLLNRALPETASLRDKIANSDWMFKAKYMVTHPLEGMFAVEWSEGFEEGYQGIQVEKGKETAEKIFNPNFRPRDLQSYLKDPHIHEQAFWGVIGAVGFAGIGKGLRKISNKLENVEGFINDKQEIALKKLSDQLQRKKGIEGWASNTQGFIDSINLVNEGKNPFKPVRNSDGTVKTNEEGKTVYEELNEENTSLMKERILNQYLNEVGINAIEHGNFDIFTSFLTDPEIIKHIKEQTNNTDDSFDTKVVDRLRQVSDKYTRNMFNIRNSIHVKNPYIANLMARDMTRMQMQIGDNQSEINRVTAKLEDLLLDDTNDYGNFEKNMIVDLMQQQLDELNKAEQNYNKLLADEKISNYAYEDYIYAINEHRKSIYQYLNQVNPELSSFDDFNKLFSALPSDYNSQQLSTFIQDVTSKFNAFKSQIQPSTSAPSGAVIELMARRALLEHDIISIDNQLPKSTNDIQKAYNEDAIRIDRMTIDRYNTAVDSVVKWIENQSDLEEARHKLYTNAVPELSEAMQIIKLGHENTRAFWADIELALKSEQQVRDEENKAKETVIVDDEVQSEERSEKIKEHIEAAQEVEEEEDDDFFTGEGERTRTTEPTEIIDDENEPSVPKLETDEISPDIEDNEFGPGLQIDEMEPDIETFDDNIDISEIEDEALELSLDTWEQTKRITTGIVRDEILGNPDLVRNFNPNIRNTKEYQDVINFLANKIIEETGLNINTARELAEYGISINQFLIQRKTNNLEIADLAKAILADLKLTGRYSAIQSIDVALNEKDRVETVKIFLEAYVKERKLKPTKKGITINVVRLFDYLLNDRADISVEQGTDLFTSLYRIIKNNQDRLGYNFINIKELQKAYKDPNYIRDQLAAIKNKYQYEAKYQHVQASNNKEAAEVVKRSSPNTPVTVKYDPTGEGLDRNVRFFIDGVEVGYLAPVGVNETHTEFWSVAKTGFIFNVRKDGEEILSDNFDKLFEALLLDESNYSDLQDAIFVAGLNNEDIDVILNNDIIKSLINDGHIVIPKTYVSNREKAEYIKNQILNITNYNITAESNDEKWVSYTAYRIKLFDNYKMTHELMTARQADIRFKNVWQGGVNYNTEGIEYDCNTRGFNAKDNPVIAVLSTSTNGTTGTSMIAEGIDTPFKNAAGFSNNTMGFLVRNATGGPAIARITSFKSITDNTKIAQLFDKTFTELINKYLTDTSYTFEKFRDDLKQLLGGNKYAGKSIFNGLSVISTGDAFFLATPRTDATKGKFLLTVNKYKKGTREENRQILFNTTGSTKDNRVLRDTNVKTRLNKLMDVVHKNLRFNGTYFTLKNINASNVENTKYMYIENNKFVIELGGKKLVYDSFTDFALKENICRTNQEVDENGGYFDSEWNIKSLFVDVTTINYTSPVKGLDYAAVYKSLEDFKNLNTSTPIPTIDLLTVGNVSQEYIDFVKYVKTLGIDLVPEAIFYSTDGGYNAKFKPTTGKIYITNKFINSATNDLSIITPLIHEQIHAQFAKLDAKTKEKILNDLSEVYYNVVKYLKRDINSNNKEIANLARTLLDWINNNNFSPEKYGENLPKTAREKYYAQDETARLQHFMEEFLVESMTNPSILYYLNNTEYREANIESTGSKSLLQRILELLLELFNKIGRYKNKLPKINNNSILATQFKILDGNYVKVDNTQTEQDVGTTEQVKPAEPVPTEKEKKDEPVVPTESVEPIKPVELAEPSIKDINDEYDGFGFNEDELGGLESDDDSMFSSIPAVDTTIFDETRTIDDRIIRMVENSKQNPDNITFADNMDEYLNNFDEQDRDNIKKALEDGTFTWVCI